MTRLTLAAVRAELRDLGVAIRRTHEGELRVIVRGHDEPKAYYTSDLADALDTGRLMVPRLKRCSCCGGGAGRWVQWHNRDTGYGICVPCVEMMRARFVDSNGARGESAEDITRLYGREGVHWGVQLTREQWNRIHADFKSTTDGARSCFAGALPDGLTSAKGTALVFITLVD